MNGLLRDVRYAFRSLRGSPAFTLVAVLTLALGIGATTAIFSVVNAVLLRPLPFAEPEELMVLWETKQGRRWPVAVGNFADWRERAESFSSMALADLQPAHLTGGAVPLEVSSARVTPTFFDLLRIEPTQGRGFAPDEDRPGRERVAVLSHAFWRDRLGGDPALVGETLRLDDQPYQVIGVLPEGFRFPYLGERIDLWVPRVVRPEELSPDGRGNRSVGVIARLADGTSLRRAGEEMERVAAGLAEEHPVMNGGWSVEVVPLYQQAVRNSGQMLWFLLAAVGALLLVALANVTNLWLARSSGRRREVALRVALGAGRAQVVRQLVVEAVVLALVAGGAGLLLAAAGTRALELLAPALPRLQEVGLDLRVLGFALAMSLAVGVALGLAPVLRALRGNHYEALKEGGPKASAGKRAQWVGNLLLVAESALVVVLLVWGGLMLRGFDRLTGEDPGFAVADRVAVRVNLPRVRYPEDHQAQSLFRRLEERMERLPGVRGVGLVSSLPLIPGGIQLGFVETGRPVDDPSQVPLAGFDVVTPGYFETAGIPLLRGRLPSAGDREGAAPVVVINQAMAQRHWPDDDPLGRRLQIRDPNGPWVEIVGVVGDVRHQGLDDEPRPAMYQPLAQMAIPRRTMEAVVWAEPERTAALLPRLREAVWALDRDLPVEVRSLERVLADSVGQERFQMLLLGLFGVVALLLGAIGVYGVVSYFVSQQRQPTGIRLALGARRADILRWVTLRGLTPVVVGLALGVAVALALGEVVSSRIYEVSPADPLTFGAIALILLVVAVVAILVPARRATRVDPAISLRGE